MRGSHLRVNMAGGASFRGYTQPTPSGDLEAILSFNQRSVATYPPIFGLALLLADDSGYGAFVYNNPMLFAAYIKSGGVYGNAIGAVGGVGSPDEGRRIWLRARRIDTICDFATSLDGETWHVHHSTTLDGVVKVGIVRVFNSPATHILHIDRFDMRSL